MPGSLSPIKESLLDLTNVLYHATILELKLRQKEKEGESLGDRAELEGILDSLQVHYETSSHLFSAEEAALTQRYGQKLISWFEGIRRNLIEILSQTSVLLTERTERKKKIREEGRLLQLLLDEMVALRTHAMKIEEHVAHAAVQKRAEPSSLPSPDDQTSPRSTTLSDEVLDSVMNSETTTGGDLAELLENTKAGIHDFRGSRHAYVSKADSLHRETVGRPIIPVCSVEIDPIKLDPVVRQIITEESEFLYRHFLSNLTEEIGKKGEATRSNLTKTMADANKVACKALVFCLGCDDLGVLENISLNGHSFGSDTIA